MALNAFCKMKLTYHSAKLLFFTSLMLLYSCSLTKKSSSNRGSNSSEFESKIQDLKIVKSLEAVDQKIYLKDYTAALELLNVLNAEFPRNDKIISKIDEEIGRAHV